MERGTQGIDYESPTVRPRVWRPVAIYKTVRLSRSQARRS